MTLTPEEKVQLAAAIVNCHTRKEVFAAGIKVGMERAAKICEDCKTMMFRYPPIDRKEAYDIGCDTCAAAIRAASEQ